MTLQEALQYGKTYLEENQVEDSKVDAWYLLEYVIKENKSYFLMHQQDRLKAEQEQQYKEVLALRGSHIPLQHITKEQEFMGLPFKVNEHVLIPRQDTEILVEEVLKDITGEMSVLDMCTGSGCIIISLKHYKDKIKATGVDISSEALKIAKENASLNRCEVQWIESNLFEKVEETFDVIVSNPPYIPTRDIENLAKEVRLHDPMIALDGLEDGLHFYREITKNALRHLKPNGLLCFEIGHDQGEAVSMLMKDSGFVNVRIEKDLAGLDRVVIGNT
jgi:release factor glutamine methyltransferase